MGRSPFVILCNMNESEKVSAFKIYCPVSLL